MSVYEFNSYKAFISESLARLGRRGVITALAEAAGCQRSYLSHVLHGNAHLTPDHALGVANFFGLSENETDYFILLVDRERAATSAMRQRIERKLQNSRKEHLSVSRRVRSQEEIQGQIADFYYSAWHYSAIHIATSSPRLQSAKSIAEHLSLPLPIVEEALAKLAEGRLVAKEKGSWKLKGSSVHLPNSSSWTSINHSNWRQRAVLNSQQKEGLHYTSVFTLAPDDYLRVSEEILRAIERSRKIIVDSSTETLAAFCCDLFRL